MRPSPFQIKKADRKNVKLRIGFWGASGSGKTYSALKFAHGFIGDWSKIAVLDTENGSAELYSHLGDFMHVNFPAPFSPDRYIEAMDYVQAQPGIELIIMDSISHEWEGPGGCLEIVDGMSNKQVGWGKVGLVHNQFIQSIVGSRCHVLLCGRTKVDYDMTKNDKSQSRGQKVGTKMVTREGFDYEMTLAFKLNEKHQAEIDKDRTDLFNNTLPFIITPETGMKVKAWNESGKVLLPPTLQEIVKVMKDMTNGFQDKPMLDGLVQKFGKSADIALLPRERQEEILGELHQIQMENKMGEAAQ